MLHSLVFVDSVYVEEVGQYSAEIRPNFDVQIRYFQRLLLSCSLTVMVLRAHLQNDAVKSHQRDPVQLIAVAVSLEFGHAASS